jgi:hypothetical protein
VTFPLAIKVGSQTFTLDHNYFSSPSFPSQHVEPRESVTFSRKEFHPSFLAGLIELYIFVGMFKGLRSKSRNFKISIFLDFQLKSEFIPVSPNPFRLIMLIFQGRRSIFSNNGRVLYHF